MWLMFCSLIDLFCLSLDSLDLNHLTLLSTETGLIWEVLLLSMVIAIQLDSVLHFSGPKNLVEFLAFVNVQVSNSDLFIMQPLYYTLYAMACPFLY